MPASVDAVWTAVATFFTAGLGEAVNTLIATPIFCAPLIVWISAKVLAQGKSLLRLGGGRRRG